MAMSRPFECVKLFMSQCIYFTLVGQGACKQKDGHISISLDDQTQSAGCGRVNRNEKIDEPHVPVGERTPVAVPHGSASAAGSNTASKMKLKILTRAIVDGLVLRRTTSSDRELLV